MKTTQNETQTAPMAPQTEAETAAISPGIKDVDVPSKNPTSTHEEPLRKPPLNSAEEVFEWLRGFASELIVTKEIEIEGRILAFNFRRHSYAKCAYIDAKQYKRLPNGNLIHDVAYAETIGVANQLFETVVRDAHQGKTDEHGNALAPDWVRLFTLEDLLGKGDEEGLMGSPSPQAKELVYCLINATWEVVPEWNVVAKTAALGVVR